MGPDDWDARYRDKDLVWGIEPNRWVEQELAAATPGRALDLACGEGRNALWLASRGWDVTAVDFSPVALPRETPAPITVEVGGKITTTDGSHPPALRQMRVELNSAGKGESEGLPAVYFKYPRGIAFDLFWYPLPFIEAIGQH